MVKSANRVCEILTLVGSRRDGLRHAEISRYLDIPTSSLSGLLGSLLKNGYLSLDKGSRRYSLGPQILTLAGSYLDTLDIVEHSRPIVKKLAEETGESVAVSVRIEHEIMNVCKEDSNQLIKRTIQIGQRSPMYATASGKVILAYLSEDEIDEYLSSVSLIPITRQTVTEHELLREQLNEIRSTGIAYNREELSDQIIAMAAPIFDLYGMVVAAIVVSVPVMRFLPEKEARIEKRIREAAAALSRKLGHKG